MENESQEETGKSSFSRKMAVKMVWHVCILHISWHDFIPNDEALHYTGLLSGYI